MEISVLNRISDFETGISSLQSQSSLLSLPAIERVSRAYSFWKWGALIIAILASFGAVIRRLKFLIIRFQADADSIREPLLRALDADYSSDDTCSVSSSCSDYDDDDEEEVDDGELIADSPAEDRRRTDEVFRVKGAGADFFGSRSSSGLRRRRSIGDHLSDFASGKSVVKLWDNLGLGFGLELDGDDFISGGPAGPSPFPSLSPALIVGRASAASLGFWDTRAASRRPAILAEWGPQIGGAAAVGGGGVRKVYLRGGGGGELAAVGDLRKVSAPLDNVTEADVETWWDADAVVVNDELVGGGSVWDGRRGSAVTRCCDAVRSYLFF